MSPATMRSHGPEEKTVRTSHRQRGYADPTGDLAIRRTENPRLGTTFTARRIVCGNCRKSVPDCGGADWLTLAGRLVHVPTRSGRRILCGPADFKQVAI